MESEIKKLHKLDQKEINDIEKLIEICNKHDTTAYSFDPDDDLKKEADINTFLLYNNDELLSIINIFAPLKSEAEVSAFTHPGHRNQRLFKTLLAELKSEMERRGIPSLLFVCDKGSKPGQAFLEHLKGEYEFSEYSMKLEKTEVTTLNKRDELTLRKADKEDIHALSDINSRVFNESIDVATTRIKDFLSSDKRDFYTISYQDRIIGMIGVYLDPAAYYIHAFCIDPAFTRRGLGGESLQFIVHEYVKKDSERTIELEVETDNANALGVYERAGFRIKAVYDYVRKAVCDV